jgi:colanic acid/amylovoran biosynthesis protein
MSVITELDSQINLEKSLSVRKKILVVNFSNPLSHGGAAIAISMMKNLTSVIPNAEISIMATRDFDASVYINTYGFDSAYFVKHTWFRSRKSAFFTLLRTAAPASWAYLSCLSYNLLSRIGFKCRNMYEDYDIVLDLSSDSLNEYYGFVYPLFSLFQLELLLLCKKKVIVFPASIGPFKNLFMKRLVGRVLSRTDLVIAREQTTLDFLKEVGIPPEKVHFAADLAFLFEPASKIKSKTIADNLGLAHEGRHLISIAPSSEIHRFCFSDISDQKQKYLDYVKLMAELTDYIIEQFDSDVVFIPHFVFPDEFIKNDKIACQDIYDRISNKGCVKILMDNYSADEVKGIIGLSDMMVSCRMHAAIASTSSSIPTVALSFGHKFHSVLGKMLGQNKCIVKCDSSYCDVLSNLKQTVTYTWANRMLIQIDLNKKSDIIKEKALSSFYKLKEFMN